MDCIEALDVLSQALWTPDLFGTQFSTSDDGYQKCHSPCGFPLYRPVSQQSQPTGCDRFAALLWPLYPTNSSSVCRQSSLCAGVLQYC